MDKLAELTQKIEHQIHLEDIAFTQIASYYEKRKHKARKEQLCLVKQWIQELSMHDKLSELERKITDQVHLEETALLQMIDEIRVRRASARISGTDMYKCVARRDQLRLVERWIRELREHQ